MNDQYYTASEAQARLGVSKAMFFRKVNQGFIPKVVLPGMRQGVYSKRDIDALAMSMGLAFEHYSRISFSRSTPADQVQERNIGIRCFGSDFITPLPERIAFQQKSEFSFHCLKVDEQVVGYVSLFRLPDPFLDDLLTGKRIEREITLKEVLPFKRLEPFSAYTDVIAVDPRLPVSLRRLYSGILVARSIDFLLSLLENGYQITCVYVVATSAEGNKLARKIGFQPMEEKSLDPGRTAYKLLLDSAGIRQLRVFRRRCLL
jgi:hypothetical protein